MHVLVTVCVCVCRVRAYNLTCMLLIIYCSLSKDFAGSRAAPAPAEQSTAQHSTAQQSTDEPQIHRYRYMTVCTMYGFQNGYYGKFDFRTD